MPENIDLENVIREVASSPASGSVDGQSFSNHNLKDLMELDRYLASKKALNNGKSGIRFTKLSGGSTND